MLIAQVGYGERTRRGESSRAPFDVPSKISLPRNYTCKCCDRHDTGHHTRNGATSPLLILPGHARS